MDNLYFFRSLALGLLAFISFSGSLFAEDIEIVFVKGTAYKVSVDDTKMPLTKGMKIQEAEVIQTEESSFVIFKIKNHSTHRLEESTTLKIASLPYFYENSDKLEQGGSFILKIGSILSDVTTKDNGESLKVKSKNSVMGVRGTKFVFSRDSDDNVLLSVNEGKVKIENELADGLDFVQKNESIVVDQDQKFTARKRYDFQNDINWNPRDRNHRPRLAEFRRKFRKEFNSKKRKWTKNHIRIKKNRDEWEKKEDARLKRVEKLKTSKKLIERREKIKKLLASNDRKKQQRKINLENKMILNDEVDKIQRPRESRKEYVNRLKRKQREIHSGDD